MPAYRSASAHRRVSLIRGEAKLIHFLLQPITHSAVHLLFSQPQNSNIMKRILFSLLILAALIKPGVAQEAWQNHFRNTEVEINYRSLECHDEINGIRKKLVVFQFVNLTGKSLSVSFDKQMWYGDKCTGCDRSPEQQFTVKLTPNQTLAGSCEDKTKALYIVEKMIGAKSAALTKFELADIKVLTVQ